MNRGKLKNKELLNEYGYDKVPLKQIIQLGLSIQEQQLLLTMFCLIENGDYQPRITGLNLAKHYSKFTTLKNCKSKSSRMLDILNNLITMKYIISENNDYYINLEKIYFEGNKSKDLIYNKNNNDDLDSKEVLKAVDSIKTDVPKDEYLDSKEVLNFEYPIVPKVEYPGTQSCVPIVPKLDEKGTQLWGLIHTNKQTETNNKTDSIQKCKNFLFGNFDFDNSQDKDLLKVYDDKLYFTQIDSLITNIERGYYINFNFILNNKYPNLDKETKHPINNLTYLTELVSQINLIKTKYSIYYNNIKRKYSQDLYDDVLINGSKVDDENKVTREYFQLTLALIAEYTKFNPNDIQVNLFSSTVEHLFKTKTKYSDYFERYLNKFILPLVSTNIEIGSTDNIKNIITKSPNISEA